MNFILIAVIVLGAIALVSAVVLYITSKRFAVYEDPRLETVTEALPVQTAVAADFQAVVVWPTHW